MTIGPSVLSLLASAIYAIVAGFCIVAAVIAVRHKQLTGHWRTWVVVAVLFTVFAALRLVAAEEWLRDYLRSGLRADGSYEDRRDVQAMIVSGILAIFGVAGFVLLHRWTTRLRGRRNYARIVGVAAALGMIFLMTLRLASLHMVDAVLFGPLKLNWVLDLGASFLVIGAAAYYIRLVRTRP